MPHAQKLTPKKTTPSKPSPFSVLDFFLAFFVPYFVYLLSVYPTVGTEDSGELVTSAATLDIAHPSGYPLHTLLGWLFTHIIPFGNIAWRVNIMSAFFGALTVAVLYLVIRRLTRSSQIALFFSLFFAFSGIFWSQSIRAEVYTLDIFLLISIIYALLRWDETGKAKFIYLTSLCFGLGVSDHHMILLAAPPAFIYVLVRNARILISPKVLGISALMMALGLSFYLYLPIRTALGPYDNPAYIHHDELYTWDSFFKFVNRGIYGGTISAPKETAATTENDTQTTEPEPGPLETVDDTVGKYAGKFVSNNIEGFPLMLKTTFGDLLFLPLIFFVPGIWFLAGNNRKFTLFLFVLFLFYTSVQLIFIAVNDRMHPLTAHSNRPFYLSSLLVLAIVTAAGMHLLVSSLKNKRYRSGILLALTFLPVGTLAANWSANNESHNYIARDFSYNLLQSLPQNAYLLSTGKDNLTFPLYYLRKVENVRPDVDLEIYYGKKCANRKTLEEKMSARDIRRMFIDLLPCGYNDLGLVPYNFAYAYGETSGLERASSTQFSLRGIRRKMDYPNNKLKGLYLIKMAILNEKDPETAEYYLNRVKNEIDNVPQLQDLITGLRTGDDKTGMF
jgi:4-amino-4-deoxy-L-arabinose transferase-like glycosyltransferase